MEHHDAHWWYGHGYARSIRHRHGGSSPAAKS